MDQMEDQTSWVEKILALVPLSNMSFNDLIKSNVESSRKKKFKTTLEEEQDLKKAAGAASDYLNAVGQKDEDKAAEAVIEAQGQVDKQEADAHAKAMEEMEKNRQTKLRYTTKLAEALYKIVETVDWPPGYQWRVGIKGNDKLSLVFKDRKGVPYGQGIKVTGLSKYDLNALHILATRCENTVDKLEGRMATEDQVRESGIWVPGKNNIVA